MPTYLPPLNGVSLSEAEAEAAAIAPVHRVILECFEWWHPNFTRAARAVNDRAAFVGTLEATAPRNASEAVRFEPVSFRVRWPSETAQGLTPSVRLEIDGVSDILSEQLRLAVGSVVPVQMIARHFASDDPSGPSRLPVLRLELFDVHVTDTTVSGTFAYDDPANRRYPGTAYRRTRYPGLSAR